MTLNPSPLPCVFYLLVFHSLPRQPFCASSQAETSLLGWHNQVPSAFTPYTAVQELVSLLGSVLANGSCSPAAAPGHSAELGGAWPVVTTSPPLLLLPYCCICHTCLQQPFSQSFLCPVTPRASSLPPPCILPQREASNPGVTIAIQGVWAGTCDNNLSITHHEQHGEAGHANLSTPSLA